MSPGEQRRASAEVRRAILAGTATLEHIARGDYCEDDIFEASQEIGRLRRRVADLRMALHMLHDAETHGSRHDVDEALAHAAKHMKEERTVVVCGPMAPADRAMLQQLADAIPDSAFDVENDKPVEIGGNRVRRMRMPEGLRAFVLTNRRAEPLVLLGVDGRAVHDVFTGSVVIAPGETLAYADGLDSMTQLQRVIVDSCAIGR